MQFNGNVVLNIERETMQTCNLIIDTGNTFHKIAVIDVNNAILEERVVPELTEEIVEQLCSQYAPSKAIISSTRGDADRSREMLDERVQYVLCLDSKTPLPITLDYNRATIGTDRIAAAVGAVEMYGADKSILVVDAGTAITLDFVDCGVFRGGNISPGVDMRLEALSEKTATLPLCSPKTLDGAAPQLGHSTEEAIIFGVMEGVFYEVKGYIDAFAEKNADLLTIFIGGDAEYFENRIKNAIFAGRKVVFYGLNRILEYNAENENI